MNTPNPLVPQGSLPSRPPGKINIRIVFLGALAVHAIFLCGLLIQGCKPKEEAKAKSAETTTLPPLPAPVDPIPTSAPPVAAAPVPAAPVPSTPLAPPVVGPGASATPVPGPAVVAPGPTDMPVPTGGTEHVVAKGDNFSTIAKKYKVTVAALTKANPGVDSTKLKVGQKLQIPAGAAAAPSTGAMASAAPSDLGTTTYVVKSGDNLGKIAKANGVTTKALKELNGLKSDRINVGQKLKVPAKGGAAPAAPTPTPEPVPAPSITTSPAIPATVPTAPPAVPGRP